MKNRLIHLLFIAFMAHCVTVGHSAEPSAASKQATIPNQSPEAVSQTLQEKIGQVRAILTEIQNLLKQEEKILAVTRDQKEQAKKSEASRADYNRASDGMKHDIQQLREQVKKTEKELAAYSRQNERFGRLQVEFEKAQKERLDSESEARQAETKFAAAQKNVSELNNRFAELTKQANEAKKQSQNLENTKALLETERTKRAEALARAEKAVAKAEKAEKERLLLAGRLAELEQNLPLQEKQQKESSEQSNIQGAIEQEKTAIQEIEGKIKKDEKAREDAENKIRELKKQLQMRGKTARGGEKEREMNRLKEELISIRKQRAAADERVKEAERKLRESESSVASLANKLAAAENQIKQDNESSGLSARARVQGEIEDEQKALDETRNVITQKEKKSGETGENIAVLKRKLRESEKNARRGAGKDGDLNRLRSRLADVKKQRAEAAERLKESEGNLRESENAIAGLTNMVAVARMQEENNRETAKALVPLAGELERETALLNEVAARVDKQTRNIKALEDEKSRLNESMVLVKENLGKEGQNTDKLNEIRLQIAGQKKIRTDMEVKLEQTTRDLDALEKETKQLNQALIAAGNSILNNKNDFKAIKRLAGELRKEKELARKSADLLCEKEQIGKRLGEEKEAIQIKLNEAEAKAAQQNEQGSVDLAAAKNKLENEKRALLETEEKNIIANKAGREVENTIEALKKQLKALEETARFKSQKESDKMSALRSQVAVMRKQRDEAAAQLKRTERKLAERKESIMVLTNMIASAERQQEKDRETAKAIVMLTNERENETVLINEAIARVDKQNRNLKAFEDEKLRLNESLILLNEKLGKEGRNTDKLDEIRLQVAGQKKIRTDMESKLEQTTREQDALEKETKQLSQALIAAGNLILNNENDFKATERVADELRKEKELARNADNLLREKEQNVKRLDEKKKSLQNKLAESEEKLAQQKERIKDMEAKCRALEEEKKSRVASERKYAALARAEKAHNAEIKELANKARAADKENRRLASQADKSSFEIAAGQNAAFGGSEAKETQNAQAAAGISGKNIHSDASERAMAIEQAVLNQARAVSQPSEQQPPETKTSKQTKSRSRRNKIAEAEEHYALAIQKWDENDLNGAIEEFKKTVSLNPDAAGAYYNISLACLRLGNKEEACRYAYQAGECYIRINNLTQASRMAILMTKIDQNSPLLAKLRNKINAAIK